MRVGLFIPCLVDPLFPETALNTRRVLERPGPKTFQHHPDHGLQ